jgi:hypothetical protein
LYRRKIQSNPEERGVGEDFIMAEATSAVRGQQGQYRDRSALKKGAKGCCLMAQKAVHS